MPSFDFRQRFRSIGDASMRHRSTYIGLRDDTGLITPHYVQEVEGNTQNPTLQLTEVRRGSTSTVQMGDSNVVLERPELGMANIQCNATRKTFATWFEATARRQIKRSLDFNLTTSKVLGQRDATRYVETSVSTTNSASRFKILDAFYNDRYPRYTECVAAIIEGRHFSMAFSKRFAISSHPHFGTILYYKDIIVGHIVEGLVTLIPQFEYLAESLEESSYAFE